MTQSLATTGVSTMTGPIKAAAGTVAAPSITFNGALGTGLYLAGTNQMAWAAAGALGATFNADGTVAWTGAQTAPSFAGKGAVPIGGVMDFAGSAAPTGWLLCFGQLVSTATYASLFTALGTTYGSGGGTFGIPDYRGRTGFGKDDMGGVAANRITVAGGLFNGTTLGGTGGGQSTTLVANQLPSSIPYTDTGHVHLEFGSAAGAGSNHVQAIAGTTSGVSSGVTDTTFSAVTGIVINPSGGNVLPLLSPAIITNKIIYAGV